MWGRNGGGRTTCGGARSGRGSAPAGGPRSIPGEADARACLVPPPSPSAFLLHSSAIERPQRDFLTEGTSACPLPLAECTGERQVILP